MSNSIHVAPVIQASTIRIKPQNAENITLLIQPYAGGPIRSVPKGLYDRLLAQIQAQIPELIRGVKYTAEKLCTSAFWDEIDESDPTVAGKCIAIMVTRGELQLIAAGKTSSHARLYELL